MSQARIPRAGEFYRHFKGMLYQIITIAIHSETKEPLVIYQALYGDFKTYARPLSMFISEVDKEKYPEVSAIYRFELITDLVDPIEDVNKSAKKEAVNNSAHIEEQNNTVTSNEAEQINKDLLDFLDAPGCEEKLEILYSIRKRIDERLITDIELSLDIYGQDGSIEDRINQVKNNFICGQDLRATGCDKRCL